MAHHPTTGRRDARTPSPTWRARTAGLGITLLLMVAGCAIGAPSERTTPPPPTEVPGGGPPRPPEAALGGLTDPPDPGSTGALGSWTWAEAGDDAPWLVPSAGGTATAGSELAVRFEPDATAGTWTARWARVVDGAAGDVIDSAAGSGPVVLTAPGAGTWGLQVDARFGPGQQGAWYWRLEVVP